MEILHNVFHAFGRVLKYSLLVIDASTDLATEVHRILLLINWENYIFIHLLTLVNFAYAVKQESKFLKIIIWINFLQFLNLVQWKGTNVFLALEWHVQRQYVIYRFPQFHEH